MSSLAREILLIIVLEIIVVAATIRPSTRTYRFYNSDFGRISLTLPFDLETVHHSPLIEPGWIDAHQDRRTQYEKMVVELHDRGHFRTSFAYQILTDQLPKDVSDEQFTEVLLDFVQSLPYRNIPITYRQQTTHDILPPLIALYEQYGDCDTKSLLFAALATHRHPVLYLMGPTHVFIGLPRVPQEGETYVTIHGRSWVLCELTGKWGVGCIPENLKSDFKKGDFRYLILAA